MLPNLGFVVGISCNLFKKSLHFLLKVSTLSVLIASKNQTSYKQSGSKCMVMKGPCNKNQLSVHFFCIRVSINYVKVGRGVWYVMLMLHLFSILWKLSVSTFPFFLFFNLKFHYLLQKHKHHHFFRFATLKSRRSIQTFAFLHKKRDRGHGDLELKLASR